MCWRHHDSDISDPAPKDGFNEADVTTLIRQPIDIRPIPSGLLFNVGLATIWEFLKFRLVFKDPEGHGNERELFCVFFVIHVFIYFLTLYFSFFVSSCHYVRVPMSSFSFRNDH